MNRYPLWKYLLLVAITVWALIYSLPNLYGEEPAVQVSGRNGMVVGDSVAAEITQVLQTANLPYNSIKRESENSLLVRVKDVNTQLTAQNAISEKLGDDYSVALNLAPAIPGWLTAIGADPMKLGLDLRGGVHFLLAIDINSLLERRLNGDLRNIRDTLRQQQVRFKEPRITNNAIIIDFRAEADFKNAQKLIGNQFPDLEVEHPDEAVANQLILRMAPMALLDAQNNAVEKTMTVIRNRINELGVAEPIVQRQGADRVVVDLPGVQDTARARDILGGTATVEMHLLDAEHDALTAQQSGIVPPTAKLYSYRDMPVLLQRNVILSGSSITGAQASRGEDGRPSVDVRLGGGGEALFYRVTGENVGKPMAIVFVETRMENQKMGDKVELKPKLVEKILSIATIQSALGNAFQITGMSSTEEAANLSLMLRAGALPAPISIIEESIVGPSLGQANIQKGVFSVSVGFFLIVFFMLVYYRFFGLAANVALTLNLLMLVALLSILGATLTLPVMAGIVLTLGMAVDANVLIFERVREELRNGVTPQVSINAGFDRAFATIVDANVTTLIAAIALFALGSGAVKGFAVSLTIGLMTSMFTAVTATRAIINLMYGYRPVKKLSIGI